MEKHIIQPNCQGERCAYCGELATHKVEEDITQIWDKPGDVVRHPFTAYMCCKCFGAIMGKTAQKWCGEKS